MAAFRQCMEALLSPFFLCVLGYGFALLLLCFKGYSLRARHLLLLVFIVLLTLSTGWLPGYLTARLESRYPVIQKANAGITWVVVLSGGQASVSDLPVNDRLSSASIKRLVEGLRLLNQLPKASLLLSGGGYGQDKPEALALAALADWFSVPKARVRLETVSINTPDQAIELKKILHQEPFYLVTSAIHMPRSMALFQKQGMHPIAAPTDFTFYWKDERWQKTWIPNAQNLIYVQIATHEMLGMLWEKMLGQI